jgi:lipoprotein-anchoring transpeptidase ErfK/SrfK
MAVFRGHARTALTNREGRVSRTAITVGVIGAAAAAVSAGLLLSSGSGPSGGAAVRGVIPPAPAEQVGSRWQDAVPGGTVLATVLRTSPRYVGPGRLAAGTASAGTVSAGTVSDNTVPDNTVPAEWHGRPSVLPVIATSPGWVRVRLAQRPNGSTAWLPASDVTLGSTPYRIVVNSATTQLALYDKGQLVFSAPAGVGTPDDPTPTGKFFVAFDERPPQPNPGYGPFIIVTSAHSMAIADLEGSGDAVIGIHGPLGEDSEIGTAGARISRGCVRLHDQALERLVVVPPGTPVDIVS